MPHAGAWNNTSRAVAAATAASLLQNGFPHHNLPRAMYPSILNNRAAAGKLIMRNCDNKLRAKIEYSKF